ncbi:MULTISPECIES: hypothetical protein [unclassified Myroides]|uniref:hypothetical protein n=1 Tax=unclassified Myroides TaxID=2642485 RepID=UPI003D2F6AEB
MESRDTILRLIQQTALILRAFFNQVPQDPMEEKDLTDFTSTLKEQTTLDLEVLLQLQTQQDMQKYLGSISAFDASNQEILADVLVALAEKITDLNQKQAYEETALMLYITINQTTQTYNWKRQNKIDQLKVKD